MMVRPYRESDEPILKAAYLKRGFEGGWRPMSDAAAAVVIVDDADKPVVLVAAHCVAEMRTVVDQEWMTPAWRLAAVTLAHDALMVQLKKNGFRRAMALLEGAVGKGFAKRMSRMRGWAVSRGTAVERDI